MGMVSTAEGQMQIGQNAQVAGDGSVSLGYNGDFGPASDHGLGLSGQGTVTGFYYTPRFLNFQLSPFYNRSQTNSESSSVTAASGLAGAVGLFGGSKFPASFSYYSDYGKSGTFGIPNTAGLTTTGDDHGYGVTWSALLNGLPALNLAYNQGASTNSVIGSPGQSDSSSKSFSISSHYKILGFGLSGAYNRTSSYSHVDELLSAGQTAIDSQSSMSGINVNLQHPLPFQGGFSAQYNHVQFDQDYLSENQTTSGSANTYDANATVRPFRRVSFSGDAEYSDNLMGGLEREILNSAGQLVPLNSSISSGTKYDASTFVNVTPRLYVIGYANHATQSFAGVNYSATNYGGSGNYQFTRIWLTGLSVSAGMVDTANQNGNSNAGFQGAVNYRRRVSSWLMSGNTYYSQNVATVLVITTTSQLAYGANAQRKFSGNKMLNLNFNGQHTGFTGQPGSLSYSENYSGYLVFSTFSLSGGYSKSYGQSLLTATGLVNIPGQLPPGLISPSNLVYYNGDSYSVGASTTLLRTLAIAGGYSFGNSATVNATGNTSFNTSSAYARVHYRLRKIILDAGYSRFLQNSITVTNPNAVLNSYFIGVSRWFKFF
jgi:hypothetical protein